MNSQNFFDRLNCPIRMVVVLVVGVYVFAQTPVVGQDGKAGSGNPKASSFIRPKSGPKTIRVATFNVSMYRDRAGQLLKELTQENDQRNGQESPACRQARKVAGILQVVRPDIVLLNEFDWDAKGKAAKIFCEQYLEKPQRGCPPLKLKYRYVPRVNTGEPSGLDLDRNGKIEGPGDAFGFGRFPGQYGMVLLSRFPIDPGATRTFRKFLWSQMPGALRPVNRDGTPFHPDPVWSRLRLSSKNHCDVVIKTDFGEVHALISHPTPPVFDGPEDRNGKRNHDEIRFWNDYVTTGQGDYLIDDSGRRGGLGEGQPFVILGDLNADPLDGDSTNTPVQLLLENPRIHNGVMPTSPGAKEASRQGRANRKHHGPPAADTADFDDSTVGNLRIDYVLPSKEFKVKASGVFWPGTGEPFRHLIDASDHRLVWVDFAWRP